MKKHLLKGLNLLLLTFFSLSAMAQTAEVIEAALFQNLNNDTQLATFYSYDDDGNLISELEMDVIEDSTYNKELLTYLHTDGQTVKLKEIWDTNDAAWQNKDKWTYEFNAAGDYITKEFVVWNNGAFDNSQRNEIFYNSSGQTVESIFLQDDGSGGWAENYKYTYGYDANEDLDIAFRYNYDELTGAYIPFKRWRYNRDDDGVLLNRVEFDYIAGTWQNYKKRIYELTDDQLTNILYEDWLNDLQVWNATNTRSYEYNAAGNITAMSYGDTPFDTTINALYRYDYGYVGLDADMVILPYYYDEGYREDHYQNEKLISTHYSYRNNSTGDLELSTQDFRSYTILDDFVGIIEAGAENISIYPNPVSEQISLPSDLQINNAQVFSITGVLVESISSASSNSIDVSMLSSGNYILILQSDDKQMYAKFQKL